MTKQASLVGTLISRRYQLVERLGTGLTGDVYLAKHPVLGKRFAVKVLGEDFIDDETAVRRIKREAEVISKLDHPNIVSTVDFGEMEGGRFYIVMEYVHGRSLRKELRRLQTTLMPLKRALTLLKQLCHGLTTAHDTGVIHRAIKPANVLLTQTPSGDERLKLVDFGLAKVIAEDGGSYVTRNRQIVGTPAYMAPEQLTGAPVDRRADIYSVGVIAFQMLTGDLPYAGKKPIQVIAAQQDGEAPQLSLLRPADETRVPRALERVFMRCLSIDREQRPRHVSDLSEAILMALPQVPDEEERPSTMTLVAGSDDEAARWSSGPPRVDETREIELAALEKEYSQKSKEHRRELSRLSADEKKNRVWNMINKKALELAELMQSCKIAPPELAGHLKAIEALEEQEFASEAEIAVQKEKLNETDTEWRKTTGPLRDALLNLRQAQARLMEDQSANDIIIETLNNQIAELETRLQALTGDTESRQKKLENNIQSRNVQLQTIQKSLGETQLIVLKILRECKKPEFPPDVLDGYSALESLLSHV